MHVRGAGVYPSKLILDGPTLVRLYRHVHRPKLSKYERGKTGPYLDSRQTTCPIKRPRRKRIGKGGETGGCSTLGVA